MGVTLTSHNRFLIELYREYVKDTFGVEIKEVRDGR